jgi:hypothetical protein
VISLLGDKKHTKGFEWVLEKIEVWLKGEKQKYTRDTPESYYLVPLV